MSVYDAWGQAILSADHDLEGDAAAHRRTIEEAQKVFHDGLDHAQFSRDRARLEFCLGTCYVLLAEATTGLDERSRLYREAIKRFELAAAMDRDAATADILKVWGASLLQLAKPGRDRLLMRSAVAQLKDSVAKDPRNAETHYNLACAYALLDEAEPAVRHLRLCVANDFNRVYLRAAATDNDLKSLRNRQDFRETIQEFKPPGN